FCSKWGEDYRVIKRLGNDPFYRYYFTYLNYHPRVQSMIYTTNWIERLQRDFRRVLRMRGAMPTEESVIVLMAKTAMDKKAYFRALPGIERDRVLFPDDSGNFLDLPNN
ncbi:MAG: transposase, partial [Bacteroidales bacterium]|nr:transposase [Bacteroidales bacterium]